jgi:hypothetical protein
VIVLPAAWEQAGGWHAPKTPVEFWRRSTSVLPKNVFFSAGDGAIFILKQDAIRHRNPTYGDLPATWTIPKLEEFTLAQEQLAASFPTKTVEQFVFYLTALVGE